MHRSLDLSFHVCAVNLLCLKYLLGGDDARLADIAEVDSVDFARQNLQVSCGGDGTLEPLDPSLHGRPGGQASHHIPSSGLPNLGIQAMELPPRGKLSTGL